MPQRLLREGVADALVPHAVQKPLADDDAVRHDAAQLADEASRLPGHRLFQAALQRLQQRILGEDLRQRESRVRMAR